MSQTVRDKLSPSELASLEHAFAAEPSSDAYRPLAEAYLSMGRLMEAMVVCKKGVKGHPTQPEPRLLLASVYARQGKDRKALEEVGAALEVAPGSAEALRTALELHEKLGEPEQGMDRLRRALGMFPADPEVAALARSRGLAPPPPPLPPVIAAPAGPPVLQPAVRLEAPSATTAAAAPPPLPMAVAAPASIPAEHRAPAPPLPPAAPRRPRAAAPVDLSRWAETEDAREEEARHGGARRGVITLVITVGVLSAALAGWFGYTRWDAHRKREIASLLERTGEEINHDTYASYKRASDDATRILELEPDNYVAHAYLAYIDALRWGEQGEGDEYKTRAQDHLQAAQAAHTPHGRIYAADAFLKYFSGDAPAAEKLLTDVLQSGQRSGLLTTTLGVVQMDAGELDTAAATLKEAQSLEPNSVRVLAALGRLHHLLGQDAAAWTFYDSALRLDHDHADSLLGKALLILDARESSRPQDDQAKLLAEAEQQIDKVLKLPEGEISVRQLSLARFARAQLLSARGDREGAAKLETEALTLDPRNPDMRLLRGRRLLHDGDVEGALTDFREAIKLDPKRASFYVDLSRALMARPGGAKEAVVALHAASSSFPASGKILVLLGDAQRAAGEGGASQASYEKALGMEKGAAAEARAKLGRIEREAKDYTAARQTLEKALTEAGLGASGPVVALALTELGRIEEEAPDGEYAKAYERYRRALEADATFAPAYFHVGKMLLSQKGADQQKKGREALENYLRFAAHGERADEARALIAAH